MSSAITTLLAAIFMLQFITVSYAQNIGGGSVDLLNPSIGETLQPRAQLEAWESYPKGLFGSNGLPRGSVDPGQEYIVQDRQRIPSVFGNQIWLFVKPAEPGSSATCAQDGCWVFQGKEGVQATPNLVSPNNPN